MIVSSAISSITTMSPPITGIVSFTLVTIAPEALKERASAISFSFVAPFIAQNFSPFEYLPLAAAVAFVRFTKRVEPVPATFLILLV